MGMTVHVIECDSDPSAAPEHIGQHWVNTTTEDMWFSVGTSDVSDWKKVIGFSNGDNTMPAYFGDDGGASGAGDSYLQSAGGSKITSDTSTHGFPRPIKVVGFHVDSSESDKAIQIILREKTALGVDKVTWDKPNTSESAYGWNAAGYTTFAAGERMAAYVKKNPDECKDVQLTVWSVWDD